ncbi:uncharacterized protein [Penaeus vannamei]
MAHSHWTFPTMPLLLLLLPSVGIATTTTAVVVETGRSAVFKHRVEVLVEGSEAYVGTGAVEATRYNQDTLVLLTTKDAENTEAPLVSGPGSGRAVVVKGAAGRVSSLLHHAHEGAASLNYKRALATLLTPAHHDSDLTYYSQADVLGSCEVHYERKGLKTSTWRDLTRCSHFTLEMVLGAHSLPLLHLALDVLGSTSSCEYSWRDTAGGKLQGVECEETLLVGPRYAAASQVLNVTLRSQLLLTATTTFNPAVYDYLEEATISTDLTFQAVPYQDEGVDVDTLMKEACASEGRGRLTGSLLQKMSQLVHALARGPAPTPDLSYACPITVRRMLAITTAMAGGPRTLRFFASQLSELAKKPEDSIKLGEDFMFSLALKTLVRPDHHTKDQLLPASFLSREYEMIYEELLDYLLSQTPTAVAEVAELLEGLQKVAPQLFERLLTKAAPSLSPAKACETGDHAEAVRLLRSVSGLSARPRGYVASLRPCFATDDVGVAVAAMDTLTNVDCNIQGVTELQKLGLDSSSDPEIRIAAYRGLVHCLPEQPVLLETVAKALDPKHDIYSTQVSSYVWSHIHSVLSSDDPRYMELRELFLSAPAIMGSDDPVWYDPRQHSRHLAYTLHLDSRTALTLEGDLVWGRYSPAPRALYLHLVLRHDGITHQIAQIVLRVTGVEAMLLSLPGMESILEAASHALKQAWTAIHSLMEESIKSKREVTQDQIADFIQQVLSRIPAEYRAGMSSIEVSLRMLGTHALHARLADLHSMSLRDVLTHLLQSPIQTALSDLAPLLDNTITMATASGVPIMLGLSGVGGMQTMLMHYAGGEGGLLETSLSAGLAVNAKLDIGHGRPSALISNYLWSLDLPLSASYSYKESGMRVSLRLPQDWTGRVWQDQRDTAVGNKRQQLRVTQECLGSEDAVQVCKDSWESDEPSLGSDGVLEKKWLAPHVRTYNVQVAAPGDPVIITITDPQVPRQNMRLVEVEVGSRRFEASVVLQLLPSPSFVLNLKSPEHSYFVKGFAGSRESVTQMASVEFGQNRLRYGVRLQMSTPKLDDRLVWSPSAFFLMPESGEAEVMRAFLSLKENAYGFASEFSFSTLGAVADYVNLQITGDVAGRAGGEMRSLQLLEAKLVRVTWLDRLDVEFSGQVFLAQDPHGEGFLKVGWGRDDGQVEFRASLAPVVTFDPPPEGDGPRGAGGVALKVALAAARKAEFEAADAAFDLILDARRVDVKLNIGLAGVGAFNFSHTSSGLRDVRTISTVSFAPLDIAWGVEHELYVQANELRHSLNVTWSPRTQDQLSSVIHYVNNGMLGDLDVALYVLVAYPGQVIEVDELLSRAHGGSYKNKLRLHFEPGRTISMDTVVISRSDQGVISYGLSNTFKLDTWISPLSVVGTLNCIGRARCTLDMTAEQAGDQLADVKLQHTAATGVSRTEAKFLVTHWVDGSVSLDSASKLGYYDLKWYIMATPWARVLQGHAVMDLSSADIAAAEMIVAKIEGDSLGEVTHLYNGTFTLNPATRSVHTRQEARLVSGDASDLWVAVLQGRAGDQLFNSRHFGKATLMTPSGMFYTANGDVSTEVHSLESVIAGVSLSAGVGQAASYLLTWTLNLQQPDPIIRSIPDAGLEGDLQETPLLTLESLLRTNTPAIGEVKLNVKSKKTRHSVSSGSSEDDEESEKIDVDIRLITEAVPEMGRIHGSLTRSSETYSLNGRVWSGAQSLAVVSYGVANNDTIKSSHTVTVVAPALPWSRAELMVEADHLGTLPLNFQTLVNSKVTLGMEEACSFRGLAQWTPKTSALSLAFHTYLQDLPGGNVFFKLAPSSVEGHVGWADLKAVTGVRWAEEGRALEFVVKFKNPGSTLHDLDGLLNFFISQPPYPPVSLTLMGRMSLNSDHHYILNINCQSEREQYLLTGALVRPVGSGSVRLQLQRNGNAYKAVGSLLLDSLQAQVEGSFTRLQSGEDLALTLATSLLPDPEGYTLRFSRKNEADQMQFAVVFSQAGTSPDWVYSYRVFVKLQRDIKSRLRMMRIEDQFTRHQFQHVVKNYSFFILVVHNKFDETDIEIEFPDLWAHLKVTGTLVKGKDSHVDLVVATPTIKHILEGRLLFSSDAWSSAHSGSLTYTQQGKKGRGQPFKLEVEAFKWTSNRQKYTFYMQKMFTESSSASVGFDYPHEPYDLSGYSYDDPTQQVVFSTFEASLEVLHDPGSSEYKMSWKSDATANEASVVLASDGNGGSGRLKYQRREKGRPKSEIEYLLKGNYRRFDTELTFSGTLDQTTIGRPRAINFLHSEAEGYTELVLDLFEAEGDQVILVFTYLPDSSRIRIGQFGNTFLQVGYKKEVNEEGGRIYSFQLESSGRTVEVWAGRVPDDLRICTKGGLVLQTPNLAPTYQALSLCPAPVPELTLQVMGVEEHEGPYLRVGQISGPGGVAVQVGTGRLRPLDTPPALTVTADVEKEVLEVLLDWQSPSLAQLKEEFLSRGRGVLAALGGLSKTGVQVQGALSLERVWADTEELLVEALHLSARAASHLIIEMLDRIPEVEVDGLVRVSMRSLRQTLWRVIGASTELMEEAVRAGQDSLEDISHALKETAHWMLEETEGYLKGAEQAASEVVEVALEALRERVRPPLLRIQAAVEALEYNDDQTLHNLVSRVMGAVRIHAGRRAGLRGFLLTDLITRLERALVAASRWEELRARGSELLLWAQQLTIVSVGMPHATALKFRVATPARLAADLQAAGRWFADEGGPRQLRSLDSQLRELWTRLRYLTTWHVYGEAVVLGWENAITWDGRHVSPLLTDSCHHVLVLLTQSDTPTAVTLHMEDLETASKRVFTFFRGKDRVTIDSNLKMTYNSKNVRSPIINFGGLTLTWTLGRATVSSSEGLSLECHLSQDLCRLSVTGEHFAATAGLLGVFDFDNNTDFMTSDWEMPASAEEWAESWRVTSAEQCSSALPESLAAPPEDQHCSNLFSSPVSPLRSCFASVPSSPYLETCLIGKICAAETAYIHTCLRHYHELSVNISSYCQPCTLHGEEEQGAEDLRKEIVIITDFECLEDVQDLVTALLKDGRKNRRVLVRYIGRGTPPVEDLDGIEEMVIDSGTSPLDAVAAAAAVDFSPRALKSIILFDCDHPRCTVSSTSAPVQQLRNALLVQGVQLHVVTNDFIAVLDPSELSNKAKRQLLGLDGHTSYLMSHARKRLVRGHRGNREHITTPIGNTCCSLAVETDGSVFSLHQLKIHRKYHRKIFQQLLALRIEEGWEADYLTCRRCECGRQCALCQPPAPQVYTKSGRDSREEEEEEDYEDEPEEEEPKSRGKKKKPKSQRGRGRG